jgi:hypothetical protein
VRWFKLPEPNRSVLITSGDGTIIDVAQWYYTTPYKKKGIAWQQGGLSNEFIPSYRNAEFWKPRPKSPWRYFKT